MSANQGLVNYRVISSMRVALRDGKTGLDGVPALIKRVIHEDMWQSFAVAETGQVVQYARFDDFAKTQPLEGLGVDVETLKRLCREDMEALDLIDRVTVGGQGARIDLITKTPDDTLHNNIMKCEHETQGTSRQYALRKLRKDAPELHAKVIAGDISPNAAMIEAGFRRKMVSIPTSDPTGAANAIIRNFNYDDLTTLINLLVEATQ
jgi:hypothetical protein